MKGLEMRMAVMMILVDQIVHLNLQLEHESPWERRGCVQQHSP